jgi:hypothetical protein
MRYTGKIAIPDLTKGMELIPQAYIARNKQYAAARKQQADALKAANEARAKALSQLGGIEQDYHPFFKPMVMEEWDRFITERVPEILAMDPSIAPGVMKVEYENKKNSSAKYLVDQDMIAASHDYANFIDPQSEAYNTMQSSLPADRRLNASMQEFQEKWNYQTKGLMQNAHVVRGNNGTFSIMGMDVDPKTGEPIDGTEIDGRMARHFNDKSWFTPSTMRVAPRDMEDLAENLVSARMARNLPFNWDDISRDYTRHWRDPMDFSTVNRESEQYEWRLMAAEQIMERLRDPNYKHYDSTAAAMPDEVLVEMFDLDKETMEQQPTLAQNIMGSLQEVWDTDYKELIEYKYKSRSGGSTPDDLRSGARIANLKIANIDTLAGDVDLNIAKLAYPSIITSDVTAESLRDKDVHDAKEFPVRYQALRGIRGATMNDINANMRNSAYYQAMKLLESTDLLERDVNTGLFRATGDLPDGVAELLTKANSQTDTQNIQGVYFTPNPNIYAVEGEDGALVWVDASNLTKATVDLDGQINLVLGQVFDSQQALQALRNQVLQYYPFGATGSSR